MKTTWRRLLMLGLILTEGLTGLGRSAAGGSPPSRTESDLQIAVRVHNNVQMQPDILARAELVATQILRQAGVRAIWFDCSTMVATVQRQPLCDRPPERTDLFLDFDEEIQSLSPNMRGNTLGFALIPGGGGQGDRAYISDRRVHITARRFETSSAMILGLAAAHEIGHLLMDSGDHSPSGLMRAGWDIKDIRHAAKGDLRFTQDQVKQVHAGALARMTLQNAPKVEAAVYR
jgi:hypothetical protein